MPTKPRINYMEKLGQSTPTIKTGHETLILQSKSLNFSLLHFWQWSVSDILSNATRGRLAEFIVATAVNIDIKVVRNEWSKYDLETPDKIKLEIKSAAYLQSWYQSEKSKISFSIKSSRGWERETNRQSDKSERHADVYVFCLLKHEDKETVNPLDLSQWEFYVLSVKQVNNYERSQHSITLKSLRKLTGAVDYNKLSDEIKTKNALN